MVSCSSVRHLRSSFPSEVAFRLPSYHWFPDAIKFHYKVISEDK